MSVEAVSVQRMLSRVLALCERGDFGSVLLLLLLLAVVREDEVTFKCNNKTNPFMNERMGLTIEDTENFEV